MKKIIRFCIDTFDSILRFHELKRSSKKLVLNKSLNFMKGQHPLSIIFCNNHLYQFMMKFHFDNPLFCLLFIQ